jgi:hypothetical protein
MESVRFRMDAHRNQDAPEEESSTRISDKAGQYPSGHEAVRQPIFFGTLQPQAAQRSSRTMYWPQAFERQMA